MKRYNHAYSIGFTMTTTDPTGERLDAQEVRNAILARLAALTDHELVHDAIGPPHDTYEEPPQPEAAA